MFDVPCFEYKTGGFLVSDYDDKLCGYALQCLAYRIVTMDAVNSNTMRAILFSCFRLSTFGLLVVLAFS